MATVPTALARCVTLCPRLGARRTVLACKTVAAIPKHFPLVVRRHVLTATDIANLPQSRTLSEGTPPFATPSRLREVEIACAALTESVQAGDGPWFERLVVQLRGVLAERHREISDSGADVLVERHKEISDSAAHVPVEHHRDISDMGASHAKVSAITDATQDETLVDIGESVTTQLKETENSQEPAWLQALRLLEKAAAAPLPGARRAERVTAATASEKLEVGKSTQVSQDVNEADKAADAGIAAYLSSFDDSPSFASTAPNPNGMVNEQSNTKRESVTNSANSKEPAWVRALRLLEAVPTQTSTGTNSGSSIDTNPMLKGSINTSSDMSIEEHEHANEDALNARYGKFFSKSKLDESDPGKNLRMTRYNELLQEVDKVGRAAPGASVPPIKFGKSKPTPMHSTVPPPPPPDSSTNHKVASTMAAPGLTNGAAERKKRKEALNDPLSQARGRGNLVTALPGPSDEEIREDGVLRKEDLKWSEHEFNDGDQENRRVLRGFKKEFKQMAAEIPEGLKNPRLLTAALDLALACVKCYDLDKADAIYRRCIGECRRRGLPWDVKCIQDMATLRCKQHRQADAAELLEELANKAPPHPATFINLGTVYNQLRQYEKAETWFLQAVNLKGGTPNREDHWNLGIVKKNQGRYDEALPMLEQALAEFQEHEPDHPVTIAKLHCTVAGCLHDMGRTADAVEQYQRANELYVTTVGKGSPLFCSAAEGLAKSLKAERRFDEAFEALCQSFDVHARGDAVHPTPLFEDLELALEIHGQRPTIPLERFVPTIDAAIANLDRRGLAEDGNAGLVMSRGGKVLSRIGGNHITRARELLHRGLKLIRQSQNAGEADLSHEILEADMLLKSLQDPSPPHESAMELPSLPNSAPPPAF